MLSGRKEGMKGERGGGGEVAKSDGVFKEKEMRKGSRGLAVRFWGML